MTINTQVERTINDWQHHRKTSENDKSKKNILREVKIYNQL